MGSMERYGFCDGVIQCIVVNICWWVIAAAKPLWNMIILAILRSYRIHFFYSQNFYTIRTLLLTPVTSIVRSLVSYDTGRLNINFTSRTRFFDRKPRKKTIMAEPMQTCNDCNRIDNLPQTNIATDIWFIATSFILRHKHYIFPSIISTNNTVFTSLVSNWRISFLFGFGGSHWAHWSFFYQKSEFS